MSKSEKPFREKFSEEKRKAEATRIREKYPAL